MDTNRSREPDNPNPDGTGQQTAFPTYGSVQADDDSGGKEQSPPPMEEKKKRKLTSSIVSLSSFRDVSTYMCLLNLISRDIGLFNVWNKPARFVCFFW
jgi:hypothetical protein